MTQQIEWQQQWRKIFNLPSAEHQNVCEDFELHFVLGQASSKQLSQCFAFFPKAELMLKRVHQLINGPANPYLCDDQTLLNLLEQLNQDVEQVLNQYGDEQMIQWNHAKASAVGRAIYRGDEALRLKLFAEADTPTLHLDDALGEIIEKTAGAESYQTYLFLREPLYQLGGAYTTAANWVLWSLVEDVFGINPYQAAMRLFWQHAQAGWVEDELFIYVNDPSD